MIRLLPALLLIASLSLTLACNRGNTNGGQTGGGGANSDGAGGDQALIQGTWQTIRLATDGKDLTPDALAKGTMVTFKGDKMITRRYGEVRATWTFKLDPTTSPKRMTLNHAEPGQKEKLSLLIYKIEGDTLTTSVGSRKYPESFTADTEKGCFLTVRRRIPAEAADLAMEDKLRLEVVSLTPRSGNRVRVTFKVTNMAAMEVVRAKATITVLDADGKEIGSESHWVVKSGAGNLAPGATAEDDFLITVTDPEKAASARFQLESVRGG